MRLNSDGTEASSLYTGMTTDTSGMAIGYRLQYSFAQRAADAVDVGVLHAREERQGQGARADGLGVGEVAGLRAEGAMGGEQRHRLVVHADADAARLHHLHERAPRGAERGEVDERREQVPRVAGLVGGGQAQGGDDAQGLQVMT